MKDALKQQVVKRKYHLLNIVVPLSDTPTPTEIAQAQQKALKLVEELKKGADFSQLAILESSDEFALDGGDLGERYLAELPEVFIPYLKTMNVNQVEGPIRTGNGWQLIKLVGVNDADLHHQITKTHVKHILIKPGPQMTDAQAQQQIQNIYRQIQAGKAFDALAKQYSVDAATAVKGGDMGWVDSTELVPQFAEVMDKLALNSISTPVKTPFGWHIMQVIERKVEDDSLAYQRQQVRSMLKQKRFSEQVKTWQQHLRAQAFIHILDKQLA
jgi:peptidyl-prolyl cis-trans isomerase SurA